MSHLMQINAIFISTILYLKMKTFTFVPLIISSLILIKVEDASARDAHTFLDAIQKGNSEVVSQEIRNGADVNLVTADGSTPLTIAIRYYQAGIAKLLIDHHADVNAFGMWLSSRWTPLMEASYLCNPDIVGLLIERGAIIDKTDSTKSTASDLAMRRDCREAMSLISRANDLTDFHKWRQRELSAKDYVQKNYCPTSDEKVGAGIRGAPSNSKIKELDESVLPSGIHDNVRVYISSVGFTDISDQRNLLWEIHPNNEKSKVILLNVGFKAQSEHGSKKTFNTCTLVFLIGESDFNSAKLKPVEQACSYAISADANRIAGGGYVSTSPYDVADIDGDGQDEIVIQDATEYAWSLDVYALGRNGWERIVRECRGGD
jgi:ankyrin repeat protein